MSISGPSAILLAHGSLRERLAASLTDFVYGHGGRIAYHEQYVDREKQLYFTRLEWDLEAFAVPRARIADRFSGSVADRFGLTWRLYFSDAPPRIAIFVSKLPYCLYDILSRWRSGEWNVEIPLVVSNHADLEDVAQRFAVEFRHYPITPSNKPEQERRQLALLRQARVDLVVLARYMQVLGPELVAAFPNAIINIHHAFLPAFPGARPYHAAHRRGVKLIGATSHYVTEHLDAGPIIEQDVARVSHANTVGDLVRIGEDLEKIVLSRAVWNHIQRKVLVYDARTIVFP